jgi:anti-sigma B factor antagonist
LNLAGVPYIDSAGLGEIVRTHDGEPAGRQSQAAQSDQAHHGSLSITKLLTVFETFEAEDEAVRSFSASAKV